MATIVYRNVKAFLAEAQINLQLTELTVNYKVEVLDVTTFGADTRIKKGGLYVADMSAKGFFDVVGGIGTLDALIFAYTGLDESLTFNSQPVVVTVFPNGITEGTLLGDMGFAMKGVIDTLTIGGAVGVALPITFTVQSRGVA